MRQGHVCWGGHCCGDHVTRARAGLTGVSAQSTEQDNNEAQISPLYRLRQAIFTFMRTRTVMEVSLHFPTNHLIWCAGKHLLLLSLATKRNRKSQAHDNAWEEESTRPHRDLKNKPTKACTTPVAKFRATRMPNGGPVPPQQSDPTASATAPPLTAPPHK
eukprot:1977644-Amphidinium_carterae.1